MLCSGSGSGSRALIRWSLSFTNKLGFAEVSLTESCSPCLSRDTEGVGHYCKYLVTRGKH